MQRPGAKSRPDIWGYLSWIAPQVVRLRDILPLMNPLLGARGQPAVSCRVQDGVAEQMELYVINKARGLRLLFRFAPFSAPRSEGRLNSLPQLYERSRILLVDLILRSLDLEKFDEGIPSWFG